MGKLYWRDVALAMASFLAISYVFCVAYDLLTGQRMYEAWMKLLPGFAWLTWPTFLLGLLESFLYGIYFGLVFVPLYNFFYDLSAKTSTAWSVKTPSRTR